MRRTLTTFAAAGALLALPAAGAFAQETQSFTADIQGMNDDPGSATANIELDGTTATVSVNGQGFFDGFPHAMHIHGEPGGNNVCPPLNPGDDGFDDADEDGNGVLDVAEGVPSYGGIAVSLTTEGDTSPDSGLAVERYSTSGSIDYQRTFEVPQDVADDMSSLHIVIHGSDLNDSGEIGDFGEPSSLDPDLDLEATVPAGCGQIVSAAGAGTGIATGAGGTASDGGATQSGAATAGLMALGAAGAVALRRRHALDG